MGLDEIQPLFLKDTAYIISRARVVPVYNSSTHDNFDNYQLISVLPAIFKILEKCVHSQLIEDHKISSAFINIDLQNLQRYGSLIKYVDQWMLVCLQAPFM